MDIEEEIKKRIFIFLQECAEDGDDNVEDGYLGGLWYEYDMNDTRDIEVLKSNIFNENYGGMYDYCVNGFLQNLGSYDLLNLLKEEFRLFAEYGFTSKEVGEYICSGELGTLIHDLIFKIYKREKPSIVEKYLKDNGYYDSTTEQIDEDYDEGFNDIEESLKRKGWR